MTKEFGMTTFKTRTKPYFLWCILFMVGVSVRHVLQVPGGNSIYKHCRSRRVSRNKRSWEGYLSYNLQSFPPISSFRYKLVVSRFT